MSSVDNPLAASDAVGDLADRFARYPQISRLSDKRHNEPEVLAQSLAHLAESSRKYLELLPSLLESGEPERDLIQRLMPLVIEVQHMLYHIEEPRFLRNALEPLRAEWAKARAARELQQ